MKSKKKPGAPTVERPLRKPQSGKHKKPTFVQQESWRYKRVKKKWRKPRGIDSKMRKKVKGWPPSPEVGYRSPKEIRGLHPSGYEEIRIQKLDDLGKIVHQKQAVRIAHTVGAKKRVDISARAEEMGIHILNPRKEKELEEFKEEETEKEEELKGEGKS